MGKSTSCVQHLYRVQHGTRLQKPLLFVWPLVYNRANKLQWRTQRRKLCIATVRIAITTVINAIMNMSGLNVECVMSASCNNWRSSTKTATFFGLERNRSTTVKTMIQIHKSVFLAAN